MNKQKEHSIFTQHQDNPFHVEDGLIQNNAYEFDREQSNSGIRIYNKFEPSFIIDQIQADDQMNLNSYIC